MRLCSTCRDKKEDLENEMIEIFETNNIQEISYELWETTERSKVVSHCQNYRDFVDMFLSKLEKYSSHKYEYQTQQKYYDNLKINLPPGKVLIAGDFAENLREGLKKMEISILSIPLKVWEMIFYFCLRSRPVSPNVVC